MIRRHKCHNNKQHSTHKQRHDSHNTYKIDRAMHNTQSNNTKNYRKTRITRGKMFDGCRTHCKQMLRENAPTQNEHVRRRHGQSILPKPIRSARFNAHKQSDSLFLACHGITLWHQVQDWTVTGLRNPWEMVRTCIGSSWWSNMPWVFARA